MSESHIFKSTIRRAVLLIPAVICLAGVAPSTATASSGGGPDFAAIDSYVSRSLAGTPGFALSIVHGDQVVHAKGFGVADPNGSPVTADTPFALGSESKSFTALGIMQLKDEGLVELDAAVQHYLPWFQVANPDYSRQITIRQLLNQTSGLPDSFPADTPVTSVESRVRNLAGVQLLAPPGRAFNYSNSNYNTLGLVIEAVSGRAYADYMQQDVFSPLGMADSYASEAWAKSNGLGAAHEWWFGLPVPYDNFRSDLIPSAYVVSSAADMAHYLIAQLNGGRYAGNQLVSASGIAEMHHGANDGGGPGTYGMGWWNSAINGVAVVYHPGDSQTGHTDMILVPSAGWGVELIADASSLTTNLLPSVDSAAKGVISMLMGAAPPFTPSPVNLYVVFDLIALALVGFQLWSLTRVLRTRPQPMPTGMFWILRHLVLPLAWRLVVAVAVVGIVVVFASGQLGASPLLVGETDAGSFIYLIGALLVANGGLRAVRALAAVRSQHSAVPAVVRASVHEATSERDVSRLT